MSWYYLLALLPVAGLLFSWVRKRNDDRILDDAEAAANIARHDSAIALAERAKDDLLVEAAEAAEAAKDAGVKKAVIASGMREKRKQIERMSHAELIEEAKRINKQRRAGKAGLFFALVLAATSTAQAAPADQPPPAESEVMDMEHPQTGEAGAWVPSGFLRQTIMLHQAYPQMMLKLRLTEQELALTQQANLALTGAIEAQDEANAELAGVRGELEERLDICRKRRRAWYRHPAFLVTVGVLTGGAALYLGAQVAP